MVSTSNDGIMTQYLVAFGALEAQPCPSRERLLEILHVADTYRAGGDLTAARSSYDATQWKDVPAKELERRLADLDQFMRTLARDRLGTWGITARAS